MLSQRRRGISQACLLLGVKEGMVRARGKRTRGGQENAKMSRFRDEVRKHDNAKRDSQSA